MPTLPSFWPATSVKRAATATRAEGSQAVDIHLGGGDDTIDLILGSAQSEEVTLHFSRANNDDHDTVSFTRLNDLDAARGQPTALRSILRTTSRR